MSITIEEMNEQCKRVSELRSKEAAISQEKKAITNELEAEEIRLLEMLQESGNKSYRSPFGTAGFSEHTSVRTPKSQEEKEAFYAFLKQEGLYDKLISVHSTTLNSLWKSRYEEFKESNPNANPDDFKLPGIEGVTKEFRLSFRK